MVCFRSRYATTPVLAASFTDCVSNTYDSDMQKGHRQGSKSNGYFILDEVYKFCVCCQQWPQVIRNNACCPPIIMMTAYRFYWHGAQQSLLRTSVSTRSLFGPDCFELTIKLKDYVPPIFFAVCVGYALFAVDNLEFYEQKKFQRRLSVGLRIWSSFGFELQKG